MRKRMSLLLALFTVAVMAYGAIGSSAWFTDGAVAPVTGTAGTLDIKLNGANAAGFTVDNMQPGVWGSQYYLEVYNQNAPVSTMPVKYRIRTPFVSQSAGGFYDLLWVRVRHTFCGTPNPTAWPVVAGPVKLNALSMESNATAGIVGGGILGVNISHCYYFEFALDSTAGNAYQGASAAFNLTFDATQVENPGWAE